MLVSLRAGRAFGDAIVSSFNRGKMDWFRHYAQKHKIALAIRHRYWHKAAEVARKWLMGLTGS
jgi:hypothetical protein